MSTLELKEHLHQYIENADDTFLRMVYALSKEYKKPNTVGFSVDGKPLSEDEVKYRVKAASKRVKGGDYITQQEIEKEIEKW